MNTPNLDKVKSVRNPSPLQYAILLYGDEQNASLEDLLDAERAAAELSAMQARIEKLEVLQTIAEDVNTWLIKNKLGGTAHQRSLAEALYALKGDK